MQYAAELINKSCTKTQVYVYIFCNIVYRIKTQALHKMQLGKTSEANKKLKLAPLDVKNKGKILQTNNSKKPSSITILL